MWKNRLHLRYECLQSYVTLNVFLVSCCPHHVVDVRVWWQKDFNQMVSCNDNQDFTYNIHAKVRKQQERILHRSQRRC